DPPARRLDPARGDLLDLRPDAAAQGDERPAPLEPLPQRGLPLDGRDARGARPARGRSRGEGGGGGRRWSRVRGDRTDQERDTHAPPPSACSDLAALDSLRSSGSIHGYG